jgi:hypothetical protein
MKKYDLSILIPSLREEFLVNTVEDILKNKRGNTEVIVGLDGEWASSGIPDHPDVRVIHSSKNLGQRGMTNLICRLSRAKYVAKCDAHCAFDEGFDVKLMQAMEGHDDWTIVPVMRNLHVFDWKCMRCGNETYQGAYPQGCNKCDATDADKFEKVLRWFAKPSPNSSAYKFTAEKLQFKYFGSLKEKQQKSGESIVETMSLQGSFFMLTREKYWELNICDESWGGWGQQGTEVALKTWLSGGRVVCSLDTWYAHMFRTQSGFAFPWNGGKISQGRQQHQARKTSQELFKQNAWDKQVRPLSWLVERFWEELQKEPDSPDDPRWTDADLASLKATEGRFTGNPSKGVIYYTDNQLNLRLAHRVQRQIREAGLPIVSASLKPMDNMGKNIVLPMKRGPFTMFKQIVAALEASTADIVFFCEHDVLYHPSHFDFTPERKDIFYYNQNFWKVWPDGFAAHWDANQVSGLCGYRGYLLTYYKARVKEIEAKGFNRSYEPGGRDASKYATWNSAYPNIDVRHGDNLTKSHRHPSDFKDKSTCVNWQESTMDKIPGWQENLRGLW